MILTKTHKIIIGIVVAAVLIGIYIIFDQKSKKGSEDKTINTTQTATTTNSDIQISTQGTGGYKIEQVPLDEGKTIPQPIPDLNRKPVLYNGAIIAPEAKTVAVEKIGSLQTVLKNNPADLPNWIALGIYQKMAGDYDGAILSWKYASKLSPADFISLGNLGNLHAYFLKDNGQAEMYYKEAISKGSLQSYLYTQLAEIYRDIFKNLDKAREIVNQGLSKIPDDPNLLQLQESLNK